MTSLQDRTRFEPSEVEPRIVERWLASRLYHPDPEGTADENYSIAIPPPNVTGVLHMGHALNGSVQDTLVRYQRMRGRRTKWILGTDHAGIATQKQVERALKEEGTSREEIGREAFVERVWQWREQYGGTIIEQFKRLGATVDYEDERFTLDERYVQAVMKVFVDLYDKGLIYRDHYLVNWDPGSRSAISDLEVEEREVTDELFHIAYPLADGEGEIVVATVRPETMLADTAVAVHPDDERYRHLIGKTAVLPLVGRHLTIIADDYVKTDFGTGALKITPGHDPNDFEIGRRHELDEISVIGEDGRMTAEAGPDFAGFTVQEARDKVVAALDAQGLIRHREPYTHTVPFSHRSGERIEPLISLQWFMAMDELAAPAIAAVEDGRVRIRPESQSRRYLEWLRNIRPWCISRQLWWGHQIPVWYRDDEETYVGLEPPEGANWERDPDVLDTWFSSALWPFATLGWPRGDRRAARLLPDRRALDRARHPLPVGRAHGDDGPRVHRRRALRRRLRALGHPGPRRAADEQVAGDRHRPARRDRRARRRRGALRAAGHVEHPGRALLLREGPPGPGAGQQALQRRALRAGQRRRLDRARGAAHDDPGPLDPQPPAGGQGAVRRERRRLRLRQGLARPLRLRLRRAVRLVPRVQQRPRVRPRPVGDDAPRPARDAAARAPGHPVRDRGAVVARPRRRGPARHPAGHRARRQPARPRRRGARRARSSPPSPRCARGATRPA